MGDAHSQLLETLYQRAVDLGDQARSWFDGPGAAWRAQLPADGQAAVAIESLATTSRLLGVMAWLLDPAQMDGDRCPPLPIADDGTDLPPGSPLVGTPGGAIAMAARRLVRDAAAIVSGAGLTPAHEPRVEVGETPPEAVLPAQPGLDPVIAEPTPEADPPPKKPYFRKSRR